MLKPPSKPLKPKDAYRTSKSSQQSIVKKSRAALINRLGVLPRKNRG